jgi:hypothetical protein
MIKNDIGINAGAIWSALNEKGSLSIREIGEHTHLRELSIYYSIGWLARENKIRFFYKGDFLYVELINNPAEFYF